MMFSSICYRFRIHVSVSDSGEENQNTVSYLHTIEKQHWKMHNRNIGNKKMDKKTQNTVN